MRSGAEHDSHAALTNPSKATIFLDPSSGAGAGPDSSDVRRECGGSGAPLEQREERQGQAVASGPLNAWLEGEAEPAGAAALLEASVTLCEQRSCPRDSLNKYAAHSCTSSAHHRLRSGHSPAGGSAPTRFGGRRRVGCRQRSGGARPRALLASARHRRLPPAAQGPRRA